MAALRALTEPCMSRSPIVHCHFMLHFYERINDDDDDDDENLSVNYIVLVCCHSDTICQCVNK